MTEGKQIIPFCRSILNKYATKFDYNIMTCVTIIHQYTYELLTAFYCHCIHRRQESNSLLFIHVLYKNDLLERIISDTSRVFFCALRAIYVTKETNSGMNVEGLNNGVDVNGSSVTNCVAKEGEFEDDISKTDDERSLLKTKRGEVKAMKERRNIAVSSIDGMIDFWKLILTVSSMNPTSTDKALQLFADDSHDFDPYVLKRKTIGILMRYLNALWSDERVHTLPPSTVRNLLDLLNVAIKACQDSKAFPLRNAVSESQRLRSVEAAVNASALTASRIRRGAGSQPVAFVLNDNTLNALTDMGFAEADVRNLAVTYRTNSVATLTNYLLEAPSSSYPSSSSSSAASRSSASISAAATAVDLSTDNSTLPLDISPPSAESSSATASSSSSNGIPPESDEILGDLPIPLSDTLSRTEEVTESAIEAAESQSVDSKSSSLEVESGVVAPYQPLPSTEQKRSTEELQKDKTLLHLVLKKLYSAIPMTSLRLLELGVVDEGADTSAVNQGVSREVTTVMVLNQMMRCLERQCWSEGLMKTIQLTWLYRSAVSILNEDDKITSKFSRLYGILHAILLLLAGRVASAQHPR